MLNTPSHCFSNWIIYYKCYLKYGFFSPSFHHPQLFDLWLFFLFLLTPFTVTKSQASSLSWCFSCLLQPPHNPLAFQILDHLWSTSTSFCTSCIYSPSSYFTSTVLKLKSWKTRPALSWWKLHSKCRKANILISHQLYNELIPADVERESTQLNHVQWHIHLCWALHFWKNLSLTKLEVPDHEESYIIHVWHKTQWVSANNGLLIGSLSQF